MTTNQDEELRDYVAREFYLGQSTPTSENTYQKLHPDSQKEIDDLMEATHQYTQNKIREAEEALRKEIIDVDNLHSIITKTETTDDIYYDVSVKDGEKYILRSYVRMSKRLN